MPPITREFILYCELLPRSTSTVMGHLLCEMLYWCYGRNSVTFAQHDRWLVFSPSPSLFFFFSLSAENIFSTAAAAAAAGHAGDGNPGRILARIHLAASRIVNSPERSLETRQIRTGALWISVEELSAFVRGTQWVDTNYDFPLWSQEELTGRRRLSHAGSSKLLAWIGLATIRDNPAAGVCAT